MVFQSHPGFDHVGGKSVLVDSAATIWTHKKNQSSKGVNHPSPKERKSYFSSRSNLTKLNEPDRLC